jgi:hypothetical protein
MKMPDQPDQPHTESGPGFPVVLQTDENLDNFLDVIAAGIDHSSSHGDNHSSRPPAV